MAMVLTLKIIFMFTILMIGGLAGYLPIFIPALHSNKKILSFGNCFAAGIFIVVGIGHLLSDGNEAFRSVLDTDMPIPNLLAVSGYLLIFFVETQIFGSAHHHKSSNQTPNKISIIPSTVDKDNLLNADKSQDLQLTSTQEHQTSTVPGLFLTSALAVHSIFEGIAVGLMSSNSSVITISIAIIIHKVPAAVALGITMKNIKKLTYCILMGIFISSTPLGILIGIFLSSLGYELIQGIFLSVSAGTFMYIGCTEILPQEMEKESSARGKFLAFCLGCIPLGIFLLYFS